MTGEGVPPHPLEALAPHHLLINHLPSALLAAHPQSPEPPICAPSWMPALFISIPLSWGGGRRDPASNRQTKIPDGQACKEGKNYFGGSGLCELVAAILKTDDTQR